MSEESEASRAPLTEWTQAWSEAPLDELPRTWVRIDEELAPALGSVHERVFVCVARETTFGDEELSKDIPNLSASALEALDASGRVRVGARVTRGDILVGKVTPKRKAPSPSAEEKLLGAIFGESASEVRDTSLRCPPGCSGVVTEVRELAVAKGERARVEIVIAWERALAVGDLVAIEAGGVRSLAVVASIEGLSEGGVAWAGGGGELRVAKVATAQDLIHARSIGPYSIITQQPLRTREQFGGQSVSAIQAAALAERAPWTAWEMFTLKSDSVSGRMRAYEDLVRRIPLQLPGLTPPEPAESGSSGGTTRGILSFLEQPSPASGQAGDVPSLASESVEVLARELQALGIEVRFSAGQVRARLLRGEELRARSQGTVDKPETLNYRTHLPEVGGLFCARVFGPIKDYECICTKYKSMRQRGVVCETCGVEVTSSKVRRERMAHFELALPVVHPLFLATVAELLEIPPEQLRRVLRGELGFNSLGELVGTDEEDEVGVQTSGGAVRAALEALDLETLAARVPVARPLLERGLAPADLMLELVPILPPDLRPLVPLDGGRFATSDLNDLYRRAINRNNRLRRLLELDAPEIIIRSESWAVQSAVDQLFLNGRLAKPVTGPGGRVLRALALVAAQRLAELTRRCVDYSGVARLVADPQLDPGSCRLPWAMALELYKPIAYGIMEERGHVTTIRSAKEAIDDDRAFAREAVASAREESAIVLMSEAGLVAREVELWDELAIAVDPRTAELLAHASGAEPFAVSVHLPLSDPARQECRALEDVGLGALTRERPAFDDDEWLARAAFEGDGIERVVEAVLGGLGDAILDPLLHVVLGRTPPE